MSTLKVDNIQGSTGTTVTIPAGQVMHFAEQPVGSGFTEGVGAAIGADAATTSNTASTTIIVDVPFTIAKNAGSPAEPDMSPMTFVASRLTFVNGILTNIRGGIGRFMKYINRTYGYGWFGITAQPAFPTPAGVDPIDFGSFYITAQPQENGTAAWVQITDPDDYSETSTDGPLGVTVNGVERKWGDASTTAWWYVTGSTDALNQGVWMYHDNTSWVWWSAATSVTPGSDGNNVGGIWMYSVMQTGGADIGWIFFKSIASDETAKVTGGIGPWVWVAGQSKWYQMNIDGSTLNQEILADPGTPTSHSGEQDDAIVENEGAEPVGHDVPTGEVSDAPEARTS